MNAQAGLSYTQAPPFSVPLRFFLTAPLFALAAALVLLWQGPELFNSRWNPAMAGITHMLTLGFMGLVMLGAILQMLPVVAGTPMHRPERVATIIYTGATIGIILFCFGLISAVPLALKAALPTLGAALLLFAALVAITLRRALPQNLTARAMRLAALMLAGTVALGLVLLSNHAFGWWLQAREQLANLHLTWGLLGWVAILIVGVAYQVVPMFQLTPAYPAKLTRWLAPGLFAILLLLAPASQLPALQLVLRILLAAGLAAFGLATLRLQTKRRRKLPDVSLNFWRVGMLSLLSAIGFWFSAQIVQALGAWQRYGMLLGVLMIVGFAVSVINGMLYKIVPFLVWFHLQSKNKAHGITVPNVRDILPESRTRPQMWLHFAALGMLLAATLLPTMFTYPAALLFGASNLSLWLNIVAAVRIYRSTSARLEQAHTNAG